MNDSPKNQKPLFPFGGPDGPGQGQGPKLPDPKKWGGWKFSLIYVGVIIIGMSLFNYVFMSRVNPPIDYSEFKAKRGERQSADFAVFIAGSAELFAAGRPCLPDGAAKRPRYHQING